MEGTTIRDELKSRGYSFSAIANLLDTSVNQVSRVAHRQRRNHRIALAIATALGTPVARVFPEIPAYHRAFTQKADRQKSLANELAAQNLIQQSARRGSR